MKNLFFLISFLSIALTVTNNSSYFHHRNNSLQAYISPINNKKEYLEIERLKSLLNQAESIKYKNILSILIFEKTLDALSLEKLDEFKQLLEKNFLKEKTSNHKIDLLIAECLYEEKFKKEHHKNISDKKNQSFYDETQELLTGLNILKKMSPLTYVSLEAKLMKTIEEKNAPTRVKCFTALTNLFSPVTIKVV